VRARALSGIRPCDGRPAPHPAKSSLRGRCFACAAPDEPVSASGSRMALDMQCGSQGCCKQRTIPTGAQSAARSIPPMRFTKSP
jgi:hypothetical protein